MRRCASGLLALAAVLLAAPAQAAGCRGTVYLTFDTGNMSQAQRVADTLDREQVRATFFLADEPTFRGDHALDPSWAGFWRARVAQGDAFGNHTWSHLYERRDLPDGKILTYSPEGRRVDLDEHAFCEQLTRVDAAFHRLTGTHINGLWRAPGGRTTQRSIRWAAACGYPLQVGWDTYSGDDQSSDRYPNAVLLKRALEHTGPGDIVLMHLGVWDRRQPFAEELGPLIRGLKARGMCFGTLDVVKR